MEFREKEQEIIEEKKFINEKEKIDYQKIMKPTDMISHMEQRDTKVFRNRIEADNNTDKIAVTNDKISEMKEAFAYFDEDDSKCLDDDETMHFVQYLGYNPTQADLKMKMEDADTNKDGTLEFLEVATTMIKGWDSKMTDSQLLNSIVNEE